MTLYPQITAFLASLDPASIAPERRPALERLADFVRERTGTGHVADLVFICTHNSRRSHMAQIWAQVTAAHHGVENVRTHSGGTEVTRFEPRAILSLHRCGLRIEKRGPDLHAIHVSDDAPPIEAFSKRYDDAANPREDFAAIMTCTSADEACPHVPGAAVRLAIPYVDPKRADGTPHEAATYDERNREIATEMLFALSRAAG